MTGQRIPQLDEITVEGRQDEAELQHLFLKQIGFLGQNMESGEIQ